MDLKKVRKENLEEADRAEELRVKTGKISLDVSMRLLSITFEAQGQLGSRGRSQPGT